MSDPNTGGSLIGSVHGNDWRDALTLGAYPHQKKNMQSNTKSRKVLFVGWGRAGKDEAAAYLAKITGLRYAGSFSWAALPYMAARLGVHPQLAWEQRHQNRELWKKWCDELRVIDQTLLARMALQSGDICAGLRDKIEIEAVSEAKLFDQIIWISRPGTPCDPTVTFLDCHPAITGVIQNLGTLEDFHSGIESRARIWGML